MEKVTSEGKFDDLVKTNLIRMGGRQWGGELTNSLILATRFDDGPRLFTCWPLGLVEERYVTGIGSGSDPALSYIDRER
jgi:20S proteasome alpha/beta subunit